MDGSDLCFEVVRRASAGFVYSEAVAWYVYLIQKKRLPVLFEFLHKYPIQNTFQRRLDESGL